MDGAFPATASSSPNQVLARSARAADGVTWERSPIGWPLASAGCRWWPWPDLLLTMSIPGRNSTAAMLASAGFVVVLVLVNVSGFRLVLARGWHRQTPSLLGKFQGSS